MQKTGLHNHHPDGSLKIVWYFPLRLIYRLVHDIPSHDSQPRSQGSLPCIMQIPAPSTENKQGGKLLPDLDRVTFSQRQLFTLLPLPYFWLPDFGSHVTSRNQGSFSKARERTLGTWLANQHNALL